MSAKLSWTHRRHLDRVALYDPFGQTILTLLYRGGTVSLTDRDGTQTLNRREIGERLGFTVPIAEIRRWAFVPRETRDFSRDGWRVRLSDWQAQGYYRKLTLTRKDHYLRLLITDIQKAASPPDPRLHPKRDGV